MVGNGINRGPEGFGPPTPSSRQLSGHQGMFVLPEEQERIRPLANDHVVKLTSLAARCLRQLVSTLRLRLRLSAKRAAA
jgi:hypothetical protein